MRYLVHNRRTILGLVCLVPSLLFSLPVDLSIPAGGLGPSDTEGRAEFWSEWESFDFGDSLALPMRLHFTSLRPGGLSEFGEVGWSSPVLHARATRPTGEEPLFVALPCGKKMRLTPKKDEAGRVIYSNGEWEGEVHEKTVTVGREDGWQMVFGTHGYLQSLTTDGQRTLVWNRTATGALLAIEEYKKPEAGVRMAAPTVGLTVVRDPKSGRVIELQLNTTYGLRSYKLEYDEAGRLSRVIRPQGLADEVRYRVDEDQNPGVEFAGFDGITQYVSWGKEDRRLRYDGIWKYAMEDVGVGHPRIKRTGPYGEVEEFHDARLANGRVTQVSADGTRTVKVHVTSAGPAFGKLQRIGRQLKGEDKPQTLYRAVYRNRAQPAEEYDALGRKTEHQYERFDPQSQLAIRRHTTISPSGIKTVKDYDKHGNLITQTDGMSWQTRYRYDRQNRRTQIIGHDGTIIESLSYNAQGRLASRTDAFGATTQYRYDEHGNRVETIDALGQVTKDEFDGQRRRIRSTDPLGRSWTFTYDAGGRLTSQTAPDGSVTQRISYDSHGRKQTVTDAAGNVSAYTYDLHGRETSRRDGLERITRMEYDLSMGASGCESCSAMASATTIIGPTGVRSIRRYDAERRLLEESIFEAGAQEPVQTLRFEYDLVGNLVSATDAIGRVTQHEYDLENRRIRTLHPDNTERRFAYNTKHQLTEETDELGAFTKREYDAYGNLISLTDPAGHTTRTLFEEVESETVKAQDPANRTAPLVPIAYAASRRPTGIEVPGGRRNRIEYDLLGRRVAVTTGYGTADAATTRSEYDAVGNEIASISPTGQITRHSYDDRNRRIKTIDTLNRAWTFEYAANAGASGPAPCCGGSPAGNPQATTTIHPDGSRETRVTDAVGQLISTTDAKGHTIEYRYTPDGRMSELIDGKGSVTQWSYDARGKLLSKTYPDGGVERYEHDAAGQLIRRIRPDGTAAVHSYDKRGHLLSIVWDGNRSEPITYTYDAAGRMTSASNTSATVARSYTATGRLAVETQTIRLPALPQPVENRVSYEYSPDGRLSAITYPDESRVQHYHNARGELVEIIDTQPMAGLDANNARYTYTRRPDGKITALTHPNGVTTTRDYDEVGRLAKIAHIDPSGKVLESEASTYDQRDRRLTRTRADGSTDLFRYDPAGQVTAAAYGQDKVASALAEPQVNQNNPVNPENPANPVQKSAAEEQKDFTPNQTFVYDEAGNRLEVTDNGMTTQYQPNAANQYAKIAHGTEVVEPEYDPQGNLLHDATRKYTWDADIHLTAVSTDLADNQTTTTRFLYDPLHRRVARLKQGGEVTVYTYDGWNVVQEQTGHLAAASDADPGDNPTEKAPQSSKTSAVSPAKPQPRL